jgi:(p)ppGpp synthase/HD superfamily hydrolase
MHAQRLVPGLIYPGLSIRRASPLEKHQLVPGTRIPYLMHFSLVAMELIAALAIESSLDGNLSVQCALLHDTLED